LKSELSKKGRVKFNVQKALPEKREKNPGQEKRKKYCQKKILGKHFGQK
jgi:hypothetical protein